MAFSASISYYVSFVVAFLVFATTAVARTTTPFSVASVINATAVTSTAAVKARSCGRSSAASSTEPPAYSDQYICYLCRERNTLMIKWCPLDKDDCHVACLSSSSRRALPPGPDDDGDGNGELAPGPDGGGGRNRDDCYVMKLYPDGSWVIVDVVSCQAVAGCYLVCSYGDVVGRDGAGGGHATPAAAMGPLPPRVADFERCGDQLMAPGTGRAVPGV